MEKIKILNKIIFHKKNFIKKYFHFRNVYLILQNLHVIIKIVTKKLFLKLYMSYILFEGCTVKLSSIFMTFYFLRVSKGNLVSIFNIFSAIILLET